MDYSSAPMRTLPCIAMAVFTVAWGAAHPARAQEAIGAGIAENLAAGRSATDFNSRLRIRSGYWGLAGDRRLVPTRISGTYAPHPSVALRVQLPLLYADAGAAGSEFGSSDLSTRVLWRAWNHPKAAAFVGLELFFPTASDPLLGTEKYIASPILVGFFPLLDNLFFIPVYQHLLSYAGNDDRADINILRFRPLMLAQWPRGWWCLLDPGFLWDLEDDLPTKDTMTLGLEVGKQVTERMTLSGKPAIQVYGTEDFGWAFDLSFTFRFD